MSNLSNVTEQDLNNLRKLVEQQKNQRAIKIKSRNLKQTHDIKLAENLSPITKKLEEVDNYIANIGEIIKDWNSGIDYNLEIVSVEIDSEDDNNQSDIGSLPNSKKFPSNMMESVGALMNIKISFKIIQNQSGGATISRIPVKTQVVIKYR